DLRFPEVDPCSLECAVVFTQDTNSPRSTTGVFSRASCRLVSFHHCSADHAALCAELFLQLFLQTLHLLAEIACIIKIPLPVMFVHERPGVTLWSFLLCKFDGGLLLLSLAQDRQCHVGAIGKRLQELSQLTRFDQNV